MRKPRKAMYVKCGNELNLTVSVFTEHQIDWRYVYAGTKESHKFLFENLKWAFLLVGIVRDVRRVVEAWPSINWSDRTLYVSSNPAPVKYTRGFQRCSYIAQRNRKQIGNGVNPLVVFWKKKRDGKFEIRDIWSCDGTSCASRATRLTLTQRKSESDPQYNETLA